MKKHLLQILFILTLFGLGFTPVSTQEEVIYHYGYITQAKTRLIGESPSLVLIDPDVGVVDTMSIPTNMLVIEAVPSPDGEWIALVPQATPFDESLVLYHIPSEQMRVLPVYMGLSRDWVRGLLGSSPNVQWSSDSQYLAYVSFQDGQQDVFVYSVDTEITHNLTNDADGQGSLRWGTDHYLSFASETCVFSGCDVSVKLYDFVTQNVVATVAVPFSNSISFGKGLCNLQLSPDNTLASFSSECGLDPYGTIKEMYSADFGNLQLTTLTNFTEDPFPIPNAPLDDGGWRFGAYDTYWYDNQILFVGSSVGVQQPGMTQERTYLYNLQSPSTPLVLSESMAQDWAPNTVSGELAFLATTGYFDIISAQTQMATWDGTQLTVTESYAPGCNLRWSPDYRYLAYTRHEMPFSGCGFDVSDINGVYFVDTDQNTLIEHNIEATGFIVPVGWVRGVRE